MKKIFSVILTLLTFISYSQSINTNTKNEVTALKNYHGGFNVDLIIDYELINDSWIKQKTDKGFIFYGGDSIYIKRNQGQWLFRELNLINYNSSLKSYIYNSQFGKTYINENFKIITFFDAQNENKKYEYYIGKYDENINPKKSPSKIEISNNQRITYYDKDYNKIILPVSFGLIVKPIRQVQLSLTAQKIIPDKTVYYQGGLIFLFKI